MTTFAATLQNGESFLLSFDPSNAASPIRFNLHGGDNNWQTAPHQCADAHHDARHAARLVAEYLDTDTGVKSVERIED